jgi:peptidoglycan/LPS O-acetylase OafA/YrhL
MFFGLGAVAYRVASLTRESRHVLAITIGAGVAVATILVNPRFDGALVSWPEALIFAALIPALFQWTGSNRYDRFVGELSYPIYILHYPIMLALRQAIGDGPRFATILALVTVILGLGVYMVIERPVERLRAKVGARAKTTAAVA